MGSARRNGHVGSGTGRGTTLTCGSIGSGGRVDERGCCSGFDRGGAGRGCRHFVPDLGREEGPMIEGELRVVVVLLGGWVLWSVAEFVRRWL